MQTLTCNAANAHSADRIRVNGINVGWTLTASEHRMQADTLDQAEDWAERAAAMMPLGRLIQPDEAARLAIYLLSLASEPMSGVSMGLDQMIAGALG